MGAHDHPRNRRLRGANRQRHAVQLLPLSRGDSCGADRRRRYPLRRSGISSVGTRAMNPSKKICFSSQASDRTQSAPASSRAACCFARHSFQPTGQTDSRFARRLRRNYPRRTSRNRRDDSRRARRPATSARNSSAALLDAASRRARLLGRRIPPLHQEDAMALLDRTTRLFATSLASDLNGANTGANRMDIPSQRTARRVARR